MPDTNADRGDFPVRDPCPGKPLAPAGRDAECGTDPDEQLLKRAEVAVKVLAVIAQVKDRVADELARPVESSLPAAIDLDDGMGKVRRAAQAGLVRGAADGINRVMFEKEELI